jgi:hypothetical protein
LLPQIFAYIHIRRNIVYRFLIVLVSILAIVGVSFAQSAEPCLGLSNDDCTLYYDLQEQTPPESTGFESTIDFEFNIPDEEIPEFSLGLSGAYVTDTDAAKSALESFGAVRLKDVSLGSLVTLVDDVISAWDAELSVDLSDIPDMPFQDALTLYLVDGVAYADLRPFAMFDPSLDGVFGIDVFEGLDFLLSNVTMADIMSGLEAMDSAGGMGFGEDGDMFGNFGQMFMPIDDQLSDADIESFMGISRLADEEADGETITIFESTIDFASALNVPAIRQQTIANLKLQVASGSLPPSLDLEAFVDVIQDSMADTDIVVRERYIESSGILLGFDMDMGLVIDAAMLAEFFGESVDDAMMIEIDIAFDFERNRINEVESIELPEGATIVPFSELMGG